MSDSEYRGHLLETENLCVRFGSGRAAKDAVRKVSLSIEPGETYGLLGESGCGKTVIGKCIAGLVEPSEGGIRFEGVEMTGAHIREELRKKATDGIQMIFRESSSSLNPRKKVGDIIGAGPDLHRLWAKKSERRARIQKCMERAGLPQDLVNCYPGMLTDWEKQRVGIARALALEPKLIVADECAASPDASMRTQNAKVLKKIMNETSTAFLFLSRDLSTVRFLSDRIGVMHDGYLIEEGTPDELFLHPVHPCTRNLLRTYTEAGSAMRAGDAGGYGFATSGIDYENADWHGEGLMPGHRVWCTDPEYRKWRAGI